MNKISSIGNSKSNLNGQWHKSSQFGGMMPQAKPMDNAWDEMGERADAPADHRDGVASEQKLQAAEILKGLNIDDPIVAAYLALSLLDESSFEESRAILTKKIDELTGNIDIVPDNQYDQAFQLDDQDGFEENGAEPPGYDPSEPGIESWPL